MRLVSQNGNVDIPYDKATLLHAQGDVMARVGDKEYLMGEYSSMEKSYRVMEIVREKNFWDKDVFKFPANEDVEV